MSIVDDLAEWTYDSASPGAPPIAYKSAPLSVRSGYRQRAYDAIRGLVALNEDRDSDSGLLDTLRAEIAHDAPQT